MAIDQDLTKASSEWLLEELGKLTRYRATFVKQLGWKAYETRCAAIGGELARRNIALPDDPAAERPPCRLHPLADHVVVLPEHQSDMTPGGIIRPESAKEVPMQGEVLAVGPGVVEPGIGTRVPAVSVGDQILFGRYSGIEFTLDDQKLLIMREADVLGVLT